VAVASRLQSSIYTIRMTIGQCCLEVEAMTNVEVSLQLSRCSLNRTSTIGIAYGYAIQGLMLAAARTLRVA